MRFFNNEGWSTWEEYLELRDAAVDEVPAEFMSERSLNELPSERPLFDEEDDSTDASR